jgi:hypothetical protein
MYSDAKHVAKNTTQAKNHFTVKNIVIMTIHRLVTVVGRLTQSILMVVMLAKAHAVIVARSIVMPDCIVK